MLWAKVDRELDEDAIFLIAQLSAFAEQVAGKKTETEARV
jgi:hypothetical protein